MGSPLVMAPAATLPRQDGSAKPLLVSALPLSWLYVDKLFFLALLSVKQYKRCGKRMGLSESNSSQGRILWGTELEKSSPGGCCISLHPCPCLHCVIAVILETRLFGLLFLFLAKTKPAAGYVSTGAAEGSAYCHWGWLLCGFREAATWACQSCGL